MVRPRKLNWPWSVPAGHARGTGAARGKRQDDEHGAVLILALVFLVAAGSIITALLGWGGNDIKDVAEFQNNRTLNYAAGSAMQVQMQAVRYDSSKCANNPYSSIPIPNPNPSNNVTIDIWCTITMFNPAKANTRVVTLTACSDTARLANACSQANPYLTVVVTFDDYSSTNQFSQSTPCTPETSSSCGTTMTINSWTYN